MLSPRIVALVLALTCAVNAQVDLGSAYAFGVLGGSTVTNTGPSTVKGSVGVYAGTAITGFPPGVIRNGAKHSADAVAQQAQGDVTTAYNAAAAQPSDVDLTGQDLGGMNLVRGVYSFSAGAQLTGNLVLNGKGSTNGVWIFQIGTALTTATAASVQLINGASPCNVFWQVGSSATIGTGTTFTGNILALMSITMVNAATSNGGLYARNGAVTLDSNNVMAGLACDAVTSSTTVASTAALSKTTVTSTIAVSKSTVTSTIALSKTSRSTTSNSIGSISTIITTISTIGSIPVVSTITTTINTASSGTASEVTTPSTTALSSNTGTGTLGTGSSTNGTPTRTTITTNGTVRILILTSSTTSQSGTAASATSESSLSAGSTTGRRATETIASATSPVLATEVITVTCSTAPTTISCHDQTFVIETPCTSVLSVTWTPTCYSSATPSPMACKECMKSTSLIQLDHPEQAVTKLDCLTSHSAPTSWHQGPATESISSQQPVMPSQSGPAPPNGNVVVTATAAVNWPNAAIMAAFSFIVIATRLL